MPWSAGFIFKHEEKPLKKTQECFPSENSTDPEFSVFGHWLVQSASVKPF